MQINYYSCCQQISETVSNEISMEILFFGEITNYLRILDVKGNSSTI